MIEERGEEVVFFDGRNAFESTIGKFDHLKDRPIITYCTGGIRCEVLTSVMRSRGFREVYQIEGGIVRYGEEFGDRGLWEGSLYVFDSRMNHEFSDDVTVIGVCERCGSPTSQFYNCANLACRKLILLCAACRDLNVSTSCHASHADGDQLPAPAGRSAPAHGARTLAPSPAEESTAHPHRELNSRSGQWAGIPGNMSIQWAR